MNGKKNTNLNEKENEWQEIILVFVEKKIGKAEQRELLSLKDSN